jgi:hypothetical protein
MSLAGGDLTTLSRLQNWLEGSTSNSMPILSQLITACSNGIRSKLNRAGLASQTFVRTFNGTGNKQLVLPDYPVTAITNVQMGAAIIGPSPLPNPITGLPAPPTLGYGYRFVPWNGSLPSENAVLEFVNGVWWHGSQNIQITYNAGYLVSNEPWTIPSSPGPYGVTTLQLMGFQCKDNGVVYASSGVALKPVASAPTVGQYIPPPDTSPGLYTFSSSDAGAAVEISYSFVPSDLEEATIQYVAERWSYRGRVGQESKSLGGQETMRFMRGGGPHQMFPDLPPEIESLIWPYVSVVPPAIGASV